MVLSKNLAAVDVMCRMDATAMQAIVSGRREDRYFGTCSKFNSFSNEYKAQKSKHQLPIMNAIKVSPFLQTLPNLDSIFYLGL